MKNAVRHRKMNNGEMTQQYYKVYTARDLCTGYINKETHKNLCKINKLQNRT